MAAIEELSDSELRRRLIEYGFEAGPVTGTTRKLFEKKLTTLMTQNAKPSKAAGAPKVNRTLSRFSSAEEDSDDALANSKRKSMAAPASAKRKSMGRTARAAAAAREAQMSDNLLMPSPPAPAEKSLPPARGRYSLNEAALRKDVAPTLRNSRRTIAPSSPLKASHSGTNGFDTGSDSDVPSPSHSRLSPHKTHQILQDNSSSRENEDDKPITSLLSNLSERFLAGNESPRQSSPELGNEYLKHRINVGRDSSPTDTPDAPYLSKFARRLSQLKAHSIG